MNTTQRTTVSCYMAEMAQAFGQGRTLGIVAKIGVVIRGHITREVVVRINVGMLPGGGIITYYAVLVI